MGGAPAPEPMGGASDVPPAPEGDMGPSGGPGDPGAPMEDPSMGGGMDDGQLNPDMGVDPMGGEEPPMDGGEGGETGDDSTMSLFNQLSDDDKEAARGYIESMLSRDEGNKGDMGGEEPMPEGPTGPEGGPGDAGAPMMESFVFSKKQIRTLNENLPVMDMKKDDVVNDKKKGGNTPKKSPFNSPKFK